MTVQEQYQRWCPDCLSKMWGVGKRQTASGVYQYPIYCQHCGYVSAVCVKKAIAVKMDVPELKPARPLEVCEVCGHEGAELHHWAPRHLFDDCEDWPKANLCWNCHKRWHDTLTPNMTQKECDV